MKRLLSLAAVALLFVACQSPTNDQTSDGLDTIVEAIRPNMGTYTSVSMTTSYNSITLSYVANFVLKRPFLEFNVGAGVFVVDLREVQAATSDTTSLGLYMK